MPISIEIYGAGMAGLIAANMLRRRHPIIMEKAKSLPSNHEALLRFRTDAVSRATGIPFRAVAVQKGVVWNDRVLSECPLDAANAYAYKVAERYMIRSVINLATELRWIAPPDFIEQLADGLNIQYGIDAEISEGKKQLPIISTIPMPVVINKLGLSKVPEFKSRQIYVITCDITYPECDLYQTLYFPNQFAFPYRASVTGKRLIVETMINPDDGLGKQFEWSFLNEQIRFVLNYFGMHSASFGNVTQRAQRLGKIVPVDDKWRKEFIYELTARCGIYSLGRFATWRQILLDDVVSDVEQIERFIDNGSNYARSIHSSKA